MNKIKNCTGTILAGGENRRMPVSKAFIEVDGQTIIERNYSLMKEIFRNVSIVTNDPESYSFLGSQMLGDIFDSRGPMTGLFTSLVNSPDPWVFTSACDMPFINAELIGYMASMRSGVDAVVPMVKSNAEPLFAFYSKRLAAPMELSLSSGEKSLRDFLRDKRVKYITIRAIRQYDPDETSLINLNTPEDIDLHLQTSDRVKFKKIVNRRGKCSV